VLFIHITAATLVAVVWASTGVARRVLDRQIQGSAESTAQDVAIELAAAQDALEMIQEPFWSNKLLRRLGLRDGLRGIHIEVVSQGRTSALEATSAGAQPANLIDFDEVPMGESITRTRDEDVEVAARQATNDGEVRIRVFASTEVIGAFTLVITRNATWMGLVAWVILVLTLAVMIQRTITVPLRRVAAAMAEVGEGKLEQRLEGVGSTEVEPLIGAFNRMSTRLSATEQERTTLLEQVEQLNRHLTTRVKEATAALAKAQADLARRDRLAALGQLVGTSLTRWERR
jgi:methyl-accepting chemotaxis protein